MISCIGSLGDTWDLMQDYRCFPFGFGLLIWDRNPEVYVHKESLASTTSYITPHDIHGCSRITSDPLLGWWWYVRYIMPSRPPQRPHTLDRCPRACTMPWKHSFHHLDPCRGSLIHMETHGVIYVPSYPLGAPQVYYLENKGPPPCPSYSEEIIPQYGTLGYYWAFAGPYDMHILLFGPCEAFLHLRASLVGLSPIGVFCTLFYHGGLM